MGREIKFRAWDKTEKEMQVVTDIFFNKKSYLPENFLTKGSKATYSTNGNFHELMQYIGRKDEGDKEIFENDIASVVVQGHVMGFYRETEYIGVVKYDEDECVYYLDLIKSPIENGEVIPGEVDGIPISIESEEEVNRFYFSEYIIQEDITVLGNIYENPDLLEELK